jgi:hypothetical protein
MQAGAEADHNGGPLCMLEVRVRLGGKVAYAAKLLTRI